MIFMLSEGFGLGFLAADSWLHPLAVQFDHQEWHGMHAWDMIQPFFMFIVGTAMPFSFRKRWDSGESWNSTFLHVLKRAALLILWGLVARSVQANQPNLDLINVLAQIAFTYTVAFLLLRQSARIQIAAAVGLLAIHTGIYELASAPGVQGPWVQDANIGWWLDRTILGKNWGGSYATINCISSAFNTILGMWAGTVLAKNEDFGRKMRTLLIGGVICIAVGLALSPVIPINKKIWTASFAFVSTGITLWTLTGFNYFVDKHGWRLGVSIPVMVGANSIFIYLFHEILHRWMGATAKIATGWIIQWDAVFGSMLNAWVVLAFEVYVCVWLYRRKIFFKL